MLDIRQWETEYPFMAEKYFPLMGKSMAYLLVPHAGGDSFDMVQRSPKMR